MRELPKTYGDESESFATRFLDQEGFIILERNYFVRKLENICLANMLYLIRFWFFKESSSYTE